MPKPDAVLTLSSAKRREAAHVAEGFVGEPGAVDDDSSEDSDPANVLLNGADLSRHVDSDLQRSAMVADTQEPLALFLGDAMGQWGDAEAANVVAVLPDEAYLPSARLLAQGSIKAGDFARTARDLWHLDIALTEGWLTVKPNEPASARDHRLNRAALAAALRRLTASGTLSLAEQASYAEAQPLLAPQDSFEGALFSAVNPIWGSRIALSSATNERRALRLYQSLGTSSAKFRPVSTLSATTRNQLSDLIYNSGHGLRFPGDQEELGPFGDWNSEGDRPREFAARERTVTWATGIPAGSAIQIETERRSVFFGLAPNGLRPVLTEELGSKISVGDKSVASNAPHLARYLRGERTTVRIVLKDKLGVRFERTLSEDRPPAKEDPIAFEALPQALRDVVLETERSIEEALRERGSQPVGAKP